MKHVFSFVLAIILGGMIFSWPVQAQSSRALDLTIDPPTTLIAVPPGGTATHTITLTNRSTTSLTIQPSLVEFTSDGKTGQPRLGEPVTYPFISLGGQDAGGQAIRLGQTFALPAGRSQRLIVLIEPATDTPVAEYPLTFLFAASPESQFTLGGGSSLSTTAIVASNLILRLGDTSTSPAAAITLSSLKQTWLVDSFSDLKPTITLKNPAPISQLIQGQLTIRSWRGQAIKSWYFYPDLILGGATRELRVVENDPALLKTSEELAKLEPVAPLFEPSWLLGWYTLELSLNNGTELHQIRLIAVPLFLIFLLILGVAIFVLIRVIIPNYLLASGQKNVTLNHHHAHKNE